MSLAGGASVRVTSGKRIAATLCWVASLQAPAWYFRAVVSTQEAFANAKQYATELLGDSEYTLEEVEQDTYKDRRVWRITLGFPKRRPAAPELIRSIGASLPLEYKTILVDLETGEPVAMKLAS